MLSIMGYDTTDLEYPQTSAVDPKETPDNCVLVQNYPNPSSPTTSIKYYLPGKAKITLEVLDTNGRIVETLIDEVQGKGEHTINYDGSGLSSGTYFYRLRTSTGFTQTKKMLLIK